MTTMKQFIQVGPAKANELFAKLLDTTDGAIKTRERLFAELKAELELLAKLEEQHLFPALRKRAETKNLVQDALNDNKETRKLLVDLDRSPKDHESFIAKVAELKKVFQQHVRDEKKDLLPAVLKALSDEEAESVLADIEDHKDEATATRQAEAEQRRAEGKRERDRAEAAQQAFRKTEEAVRTGVEAASEVTKETVDQAVRLTLASVEKAEKATTQAAEGVQAIALSNSALLQGLQTFSREWFGMAQRRGQKNIEAVMALSQCRSPQEFFAIQTSLVRENLAVSLENSQRMAELSVELFEDAKQPITGKSGQSDYAG